MKFLNTTKAFEYFFNKILEKWKEVKWTKVLYNVGFYIMNPVDKVIKTKRRKFSKKYAEVERKWYKSWNRKVDEIWKIAKIWLKMVDEKWEVNSNYWYQWRRKWQINYIINELNRDPSSRRAVISIYDGKEHKKYKYDTPCTLSLHFQIIDEKLCMSVLMRSNDLVFWFCNDQYTFVKLMEKIAKKLNVKLGWYYHFSTNLHIYERHYNIIEKNG